METLGQTDEVLRVKEVCRILKINRMTLYDLIKNNRIEVMDVTEGIRTRPLYRFKMSAVRKFMESRKVSPR